MTPRIAITGFSCLGDHQRQLLCLEVEYGSWTVKSRPLLFAQLYVIHYEYQDHVIPGVYILMDSKSERAYHDVFTVLQQQLPAQHRHGPQHFSVDFELASANAFKEVFIGADEEFCFFHFAQSM